MRIKLTNEQGEQIVKALKENFRMLKTAPHFLKDYYFDIEYNQMKVYEPNSRDEEKGKGTIYYFPPEIFSDYIKKYKIFPFDH